ncbi:ABC transporter substrate-binding protein [Pseudomonas sp. TE3786]
MPESLLCQDRPITSRRANRRHLWLLALLLPLLGSAPCPAAVMPPSGHLPTIDFQLRWKHQFQFAGYYAAIAQGYYREEGFEVRLHEGAPGKTPVEEVLAGRAQYGESNSELLYERLNGKPLVALAAIFQHSPSVLLARTDAGIRTVHDLVGKRVMLMNAQTDADFLTMFSREGIDPSTLDLRSSSYEVDDLVSGKVQAFNSYLTNEPYYLEQKGVAYSVLSPATYGIDFYSDILFTSEAEATDHPERVAAFRRATLKGWRYAMDHPDEIIELLLSKYQVQKTREHLQFEAQAMRGLILPDLVDIGHMNPGRWQRMAEAFKEQNMVPSVSRLDGFLYDANPPQLVERLRTIIVLISLGCAAILVVVLVLLSSQRRLQREIQRRIVAEEEVRALAFHDSLTGLPNRNSFIPYATQKLLSAKRNDERLALCYLDLNKFKEINDSYGHQAGDAILVHAANAISANIREADMAARMGGDEFVVLLDGVHDADDIYRVTEQICQAIAQPLHWQGRELSVSASLGVAIYPQAGEHLDELMSRADSAMFYKKAAMLALR